MAFPDNWSSQVSEARRFLNTGKTSYTNDAYFSNIASKKVGCVDSSDCAVGWKCNGGYCRPPANSPGSTRNNSLNDQGCGGNTGGSSGGGGGKCGPTTGGGGKGVAFLDKDTRNFYNNLIQDTINNDILGESVSFSVDAGGVASIFLNGECVKTGCGGIGGSGGDDDECCGQGRCCRFSARTSNVRCGCGPCESDQDCDKFCSGYNAATGLGPAPGCSEDLECDECSDCNFFAFQGVKDLYKCQPKTTGSPCWCGNEDNRCEECEYCSDGGSCFTDTDNDSCYLAVQPKPEPPEKDCLVSSFGGLICAEVGAVPSAIDQCIESPRIGQDVTYTQTNGVDISGDPLFNCIVCKYVRVVGECDEPCDCNCDDDCADCEICAETGLCEEDPECQVGERYFEEIAWYNLDSQVFLPGWVDGPFSEPTCDPSITTETYPFTPLAFARNNGREDLNTMGLAITVVNTGATCTNYGSCGDPGNLRNLTLEAGLPGQPVLNTQVVDQYSCNIGILNALTQTTFSWGVVVGYGTTQQQACEQAKNQLSQPISNIIC